MSASLTDRQQEIKDMLDLNLGAREIAEKLGITRNAVYQQIQRMRRSGALDEGYTPSGQPTRETQRIEVPLDPRSMSHRSNNHASPLSNVPPGDTRRACLVVLQELQDMQLRMNQVMVELARFLTAGE